MKLGGLTPPSQATRIFFICLHGPSAAYKIRFRFQHRRQPTYSCMPCDASTQMPMHISRRAVPIGSEAPLPTLTLPNTPLHMTMTPPIVGCILFVGTR